MVFCMPILTCSDDNNSNDSKVFFELDLKNTFTIKDTCHKEEEQSWQSYELKLHSGTKTLVFNSSDKNPNEVKGLFCFNIKPINELKNLSENLKSFLENEEEHFVFEPLEPSIELRISKSHASSFQVELWVDAGNTSTIIYTWDALGIRFMTTKEKLVQFCSELV